MSGNCPSNCCIMCVCASTTLNLVSFPPSLHLQGAVNSLFCLPSEGFASGSADGTVCLWDSNFSFVTQLDLRKAPDGYPTLQVRSVCWDGGRLLAGTRDSEVFQVSLQNRDSPACVMQVGGAGRGGQGREEGVAFAYMSCGNCLLSYIELPAPSPLPAPPPLPALPFVSGPHRRRVVGLGSSPHSASICHWE